MRIRPARTAARAERARDSARGQGEGPGREEPGRGRADGCGLVGGKGQASRSASVNSPHDGYRSPGSLAIALASTRPAAAGKPGRRTSSGGKGSDRCASSTAIPWSRSNGTVPVSSCQATHASAY